MAAASNSLPRLSRRTFEHIAHLFDYRRVPPPHRNGVADHSNCLERSHYYTDLNGMAPRSGPSADGSVNLQMKLKFLLPLPEDELGIDTELLRMAGAASNASRGILPVTSPASRRLAAGPRYPKPRRRTEMCFVFRNPPQL